MAPVKKKPKFEWSPADMERAIDAVKLKGMTPYKASREFKVPRTTLLLKLKVENPLRRK